MAEQFDFEYITDTPLGKIYRPIAKVTLSSPTVDRNIEITMLVDTGADYTIAPRHIARKLYISLWKDCRLQTTWGVGGKQRIYFLKKKLTARIGEIERQIPIAFFDNDEVPALLGRLGFLETMDVEFKKSHEIVFKG
jgi:predicted aspartyl protease